MENGVFVFSSHVQHVTKRRYTYIYIYTHTHYIYIPFSTIPNVSPTNLIYSLVRSKNLILSIDLSLVLG